MSKEWAEKELEIAKKEFIWDKYQMACAESAYRAFCSLLKVSVWGNMHERTVNAFEKVIGYGIGICSLNKCILFLATLI